MSKFGWAYINCSGAASCAGPLNSIQFYIGNGQSSGSARFTYITGSPAAAVTNTKWPRIHLTGTLVVSGAISASSYYTKIENRVVTNINVSGSTFFGDSNDDIHARTGSLWIGDNSNNYHLSSSLASKTVAVKGFRGAYRRITGNGAIVAGDYIIGCSGSSNQTIQLPSGSAVKEGCFLVIKDEYADRSSTKVTIMASNHVAGYNIEDQKSYELVGTMPAINLYTDGTNWFVY